MNSEEQYYIHRIGTYTGNSPAWWAKKGQGYTAYITGAERFSEEEKEELLKNSPEKYKAYKCSDVDARLHLVFDAQDTHRLGTDEPCGWASGYVPHPDNLHTYDPETHMLVERAKVPEGLVEAVKEYESGDILGDRHGGIIFKFYQTAALVAEGE